jgi:chromosomal replication initiator protein
MTRWRCVPGKYTMMQEDRPLPIPQAVGYDAGADFGSSLLNPRYSLENFMVGSSNRMAYAAASAVAEKPALAYNPLFIYGEVGLGKTHLAQALGRDAVARGYTVLYTGAETFGNDLLRALGERAAEAFRNRYRHLDILIIDDVQYVENKAAILTEMFYTIDTLHQHNKQTVMCSDRRPEKLKGLTDQMRSRLTGGSIVDIVLPDMELRTAILRSKAELIAPDVPLEIVDFVARQMQSNVREMEGAFQNVIAMARLQRLPYTLELAKEAIAPMLSKLTPPPKRSIAGIMQIVSRYYNISLAEIYSPQRDRHIAFPRQVAMYLIRKELVMPLEAIGQHIGGRDHSTVIYGYRKIERLMVNDEELQREVHSLRQRIYDG